MTAAGCGISAKLAFRRVDIHPSGLQKLLIPANCHLLPFVTSVAERSDFVQGLTLEGVSWNPMMWVAVSRTMR